MTAVKVRPILPHPALLLEDDQGRKYLAVSDLHIGLESELGSKGVNLGGDSASQMAQGIIELVKSNGASGILLLGDIKHKVGTITKQEWDSIPTFMKKLSSAAQVYLVPGNHDGNIRHLIPDDVIMGSGKGMLLGDTLLIHGHTMPSELRSSLKRIVMGHLHPVFLRTGSVIRGERVWIHIQSRKDALFADEGVIDIVVMPSFNKDLYGGGQKSSHKSISPIISRVMDKHAIESCIVARLDGTIIGDSSMLKDVL
jgi:putative SbcD/Mre11-related phosphoesterase